jgi:hypothetical protein
MIIDLTGEERDQLEMQIAIEQRFKGTYPKHPKVEESDVVLIKNNFVANESNWKPKNYGFSYQRDPIAADLAYEGSFKDFYKKYKKYYI